MTKICNIHLPHQALWFGCNKEKSFQQKKRTKAAVITGAAKVVWVLRTGLGPLNGREGHLKVGSSGSPRTQQLRSDPQSLSPQGHRLITARFSGVWKLWSYYNLSVWTDLSVPVWLPLDEKVPLLSSSSSQTSTSNLCHYILRWDTNNQMSHKLPSILLCVPLRPGVGWCGKRPICTAWNALTCGRVLYNLLRLQLWGKPQFPGIIVKNNICL